MLRPSEQNISFDIVIKRLSYEVFQQPNFEIVKLKLLRIQLVRNLSY